MRLVTLVFVFALSFPAFAVEKPCGLLLELSSLAKPLVFDLSQESIATDLTLLPGGKILFGTASPAPDGRPLPGRLVLYDTASKASTTIPGPTQLTSRVVLDPKQDVFLALSGLSFSAFELSTERWMHAHEERVRPIDTYVDMLTDIFRRAARGEAEAQRRADLFSADGALMGLARSNPAELRGEIETQYLRDARANQLPTDFVTAPPINAQFHVKGDRYLVNYGRHALVRDSASGRVLKRIAFAAFDVPASTTGGVAYFLGGGKYVAAITPRQVSLWSADTTRNVSFIDVPADCELYPGFSVSSPAGDRVAVGMRSKQGYALAILAERNEKPAVVNLIAAGPRSEDRIPIVAFSRRDPYAVTTHEGPVKIFSASAAPDWGFSLGDSAAVHSLAISPQGEWLAVAFAQGKDFYVEIRTAKTKQGARLKLPAEITAVVSMGFDLEGGQLLVTALAGREARPYLLDVYRTLAAIAQSHR